MERIGAGGGGGRGVETGDLDSNLRVLEVLVKVLEPSFVQATLVGRVVT